MLPELVLAQPSRLALFLDGKPREVWGTISDFPSLVHDEGLLKIHRHGAGRPMLDRAGLNVDSTCTSPQYK